MLGPLLIWIAAGALGGVLASRILRRVVYIMIGDALLAMLAGVLGGAIVVLFDGLSTSRLALGSVAIAFLAGLLQVLALHLLNDGQRPARW